MNKFLLLYLFFVVNIHSQSLYMPLEVSEAVKSGTRTLQGIPGSKYWQNKSVYDINVKLTPPSDSLYGSAEVLYTNNSPDTLTELVIRLYPNLYKKGAERNIGIDEQDIHDGVNLTKLLINGRDHSPEEGRGRARNSGSTVLTIKLKDQLLPGQSLKLETEWSYPLPKVTRIRMGIYDPTSFFVAYWYPQIAVYDDVFGWDKLPYLGNQEYYNDFNDFNVTINLPSSFAAWATGVLQNPGEIFTDEFLKKYTEAESSDKITTLIDSTAAQKGYTFRGNNGRTSWKFAAKGVPDFAFSLSDHYLWDRSSVVVDSSTMRRTSVNAAYKSSSKDFVEVAEFARIAISYLSHELPGIPFPYPALTVFNGQGGMEFPMIVNNGSASTRAGTYGVTIHEITHMYFPFYMGINEKRYAWMDEGWAVMLPFLSQRKVIEDSDPVNRNAKGFGTVAGTEFEIPLYIPSMQLFGSSYRTHAYTRPGMAYWFLRDALGEKVFLTALQNYIKTWNGKHPLPGDFFYSFNASTGMELSWFWKPWFFESGYAELALKKVELKNKKLTVVVEREGNLPVPVKLTIVNTDGSKIEKYDNASVWKKGDKTLTYTFNVKGQVDSVLLGDVTIPDKIIPNNFYKMPAAKK